MLKHKIVAEALAAMVLQISRIQVASVVASALSNVEVSENKVKHLCLTSKHFSSKTHSRTNTCVLLLLD